MFILPVFPQGDPPAPPSNSKEEGTNLVDVTNLFNLGSSYYEREDYEEAVRWYRAAAEQGHVIAQPSLAYMYHRGQGVPQDYEEAVRWYRAANQGDATAQFNLGFMYDKGQGLPQDYVRAHMWYNLAEKQAG